jgi:hypothetical protein
MMEGRHFVPFVLIALFCNTLRADSPGDTWSAIRSLVGKWEGVGGGSPGSGGGQFSFALDLNDRIIVRRSHSEYPASEGRPSIVHDDLLVAYQEDSAKGIRAIYFDNEGHVIHYAVESSADGNTITFLSSPDPKSPRFRLSYIKSGEDEVSIRFEIAPAGKPEEFKMYLEGKAKRQE